MKNIAIFFAVLIVLFLVWAGVIAAEAGRATKMSQWVYDVYMKKESITKSIKGKKIVIVAGSNALFGVDSKMLQNAFGTKVVNFGVNAGVGLPLILYLAKRVIKPGDTVIMPLEYPLYSYNGKPGEQMIDYILSREPGFFWHLTPKEMFYIIWHTGIKRVWRGYTDKSIEGVLVGGVYGVKNVDSRGDQINSSLKYRTKDMEREVERLAKSPEHYGREFKSSALGWRYLKEFGKWCKKRGVKLVLMPSALMRCKLYLEDNKERRFYSNLPKIARKKGFVYVGKPYEYMYNKDDFFNTNYHLIDSARKKRTLQIIKDLKKIIAESRYGL